MSSITQRVGDWLSRAVTSHPWKALSVGVLVVLAAGMGLAHVRANFTHTAFYESDDPMLKTFEAFERKFGNDDSIVVIVGSPSGIFDADSATLLRQMTEEMWKIPEVIRVESLANFQWVHAEGDDLKVESLLPDEGPLTPELLAERKHVALGHELLPGFLVSEKGDAALIYARIRPGITDHPNSKKIVDATRALIERSRGGDHQFHITGPVAIEYAFQEGSEQDTAKLMPLMLGMTVLFLVFAFRKISGLVLPLLTVFLTMGAAFGAAGWLGVEISSVTVILPQILLAIGIAETVHILVSFYEQRRMGVPKREAAFEALRINFMATVLTSFSTATGFFSFSSARLKPIFGLGLLGGFGTIVAWLMVYLVLGSLLAIVPSWVKPKPGAAQHQHELKPWAVRHIDRLWRVRWPVLVGAGVLGVASALIAARNTVNSDPFAYFTKDYPLRVAQDFVLEHLGGIPGFELVLYADGEEGAREPAFLKKVEQFEAYATHLPGVSRSLSVVDIIRQTNRSLHQGQQSEYRLPDEKATIAQELFLYTMSLPQGMDVNDRITVGNDAVRLTLLSTISDSSRWLHTADLLRHEASRLGLRAELTGKGALYQSMNPYVVQSFVESLLSASLAISLLLALAFRSLRTGVLALPTNVLPLLIGGAALQLSGTPLDIGTVLVGSICLGIVVDDTVHLITAFNRMVQAGVDVRTAVISAIGETAPAMLVTTLVLTGGFGVLTLGTFLPNVYFGLMTAVGLAVGLVAELTLLPILLLTFGTKESRAEESRRTTVAQATT